VVTVAKLCLGSTAKENGLSIRVRQLLIALNLELSVRHYTSIDGCSPLNTCILIVFTKWQYDLSKTPPYPS